MIGRFNTQPPEGGWRPSLWILCRCRNRFNTQPPEGGWKLIYLMYSYQYSFNTQPPEGGWCA